MLLLLSACRPKEHLKEWGAFHLVPLGFGSPLLHFDTPSHPAWFQPATAMGAGRKR